MCENYNFNSLKIGIDNINMCCFKDDKKAGKIAVFRALEYIFMASFQQKKRHKNHIKKSILLGRNATHKCRKT